MRPFNQAQVLDRFNRYMTTTSANNTAAARIRAEWAGWFENLGWHERHMDPVIFRHGKRLMLKFISANGSSFGAERPTVSQGSRGDAVKTVQSIVGATPVDGVFGSGTKKAVIAWQTANGLKPDGVFGPASWAKSDSLKSIISDKERDQILSLVSMTAAQTTNQPAVQASPTPKPDSKPAATVPSTAVAHPTIRLNSKGDAVSEWQGILGLKKDGVFGPATEKATKEFQHSHGLGADGVVGPKTWMTAYSAHAAMTNVAPPGVVVDSTGTLPPAPAPTTSQALSAPVGVPVIQRPVGQPVKPSLIQKILNQAPTVPPALASVLSSPATSGQPGDAVQKAAVVFWNPLTWPRFAQVAGVVAGAGAVAIHREMKK